MRVRVCHETLYHYQDPVHAVAMEARLQPCSDNLQNCLRFRLNVSPKVAVNEFNNFADVTIHHWTILKAQEIRIVAESVVDTRERSLLPLESPPSGIDWVEHFAFVQPTPLTATTPRIQEFAAQFSKLAAEDWYQTALAVREAVYQTIAYETGQTTTTTTSDDVLQIGAGVCQDFTHLMVATLRALEIPARYTSGYLNPTVQQPTHDEIVANPDAAHLQTGEPRAIRGATASHAWCEVFMGAGAGWRGFCPTNNLLVDHHFVRIGAGRDYRDLTPLKGVHRGTAKEDMTVAVTVQPVDYV